jgi:hypothetical protein
VQDDGLIRHSGQLENQSHEKNPIACLCGLFVLAAGCSQTPGPLLSGKLQSGTFWKNPVGTSSNEGGGFQEGSRVEIYDRFIVITTPSGDSHVIPQGHYSDLTIKK